jgi:hypothetical protein
MATMIATANRNGSSFDLMDLLDRGSMKSGFAGDESPFYWKACGLVRNEANLRRAVVLLSERVVLGYETKPIGCRVPTGFGGFSRVPRRVTRGGFVADLSASYRALLRFVS